MSARTPSPRYNVAQHRLTQPPLRQVTQDSRTGIFQCTTPQPASETVGALYSTLGVVRVVFVLSLHAHCSIQLDLSLGPPFRDLIPTDLIHGRPAEDIRRARSRRPSSTSVASSTDNEEAEICTIDSTVSLRSSFARVLHIALPMRHHRSTQALTAEPRASLDPHLNIVVNVDVEQIVRSEYRSIAQGPTPQYPAPPHVSPCVSDRTPSSTPLGLYCPPPPPAPPVPPVPKSPDPSTRPRALSHKFSLARLRMPLRKAKD